MKQEQTITLLRKSFNDLPTRKTIYLILFELVFFLLFLIALGGYRIVMLKLAEGVGPVMEQLQNIAANPTTEGNVPIDPLVFDKFMAGVVIATLVLLLALIVSLAISRSLIWARLLDKESTQQLFVRFLFLHLVWMPILLVLGILGAVVLNGVAPITLHPNVFLISVLFFALLCAYFAQFLYSSFATRKEKFFSQFAGALKLGFTQISAFITPYLLVIAVFFVMGLLNQILFRSLSLGTARWLQLIILLLFLTWFRYFIVRVMRRDMGA